MRPIKQHVIAKPSVANTAEITAALDIASDANIMFKSGSGSRQFNVQKLNLKYNNTDSYVSDSEYEQSDEMIKLNKPNQDKKSMDNDGFIQPPAKKLAKIVNTATPTTSIQNKFGILETQETMETGECSQAKPTTTKKQWVPPLIVHSQIANYKMFNEQITSTLQHRNFTVLYRNTGTKIITYNMQDRQKLINDFKNSNVNFHSFTPNEEKLKKIVLKGAPQMNIDEIKEDLIKKGTTVENIIPLKTKRNQESFSYLVTVKQGQSLQDMRKIRNIDQCGIKWEKYSKKNNYTQCYNCQAFGHAEINCNQRSKCVKCRGFHHWKNCTMQKTDTSKAYCHNCGGDHAASYKNCPALMEYLQKRNEAALSRAGPNTQNIIPLQPAKRNVTTQGPGLSNQGTNLLNQNISSSSNRSYKDALLNKQEEEPNNCINSFINCNNENDEIGELLSLLKIVKSIKNELANCKNQFDKMSVIIKYLDKF